MPDHTPHTVEQGEDLVSIALKHRTSADAIWNDPANAAVAAGGNPYVLKPGVVLQIPPREPKRVPVETDRVHTFRRKGLKEALVLHLRRGGKARGGLDYVLEVEGEPAPFTGTTGAEDGKIEHSVAPTARKATLTLTGEDGEEETYQLLLGHLDPVTEPSGLRARLSNLGFLASPDADDEATGRAVSAFQEHAGLKVTGAANAATRERLVKEHGS